VLISEPGSPYQAPFVPYVWAVLKSYCERHSPISEDIEWLPPIADRACETAPLSSHTDVPIDVLGLSCYTWNWELQCRIAEQAKASNPRCLVVAGGPEPDYKDRDFFRKYPYIDAIVVKDGEIPFARILAKVVNDDSDLSDIGGLYLPAPAGRAPANTGPAEVPMVFDYSPYLDQREYFESVYLVDGRSRFNATLETNRGCPYACSFCDWGSATMSKVRRFDMDRIAAEIEWLARLKVSLLFLADANFGILSRDTDIAEMVASTYRRSGHPRFFTYCSAKNNPDRSVAITRTLHLAGITPRHELSIQHTREDVLAATDRANISPHKQVEVVRRLMEDGVPIAVQLIRGIPGDTYDKSKACLTDLMEWGIHGNYEIYPYQLLPNAPAAEPAFLAKWQVGTVTRRMCSMAGGQWEPADLRAVPTGKIIVESSTFSQDEWVRMNTFGAFVQALHNTSLTRLIAIYLRFTHDVQYRDFYEAVVEDFCVNAAPVARWHRTVVDHYRDYLVNDEAVAFIKTDEIPGYHDWLEPQRWLYVTCCVHFEEFFDALKTFLLARYPAAANLASAIDYQRQLIIVPSYDRKLGKTFRTELDWVEYFSTTSRLTTVVPLGEPSAAPGGVVEVTDQTCSIDETRTYALDWHSAPETAHWPMWIARTVTGQASMCGRRTTFRQLQLTYASAAVG
jgi:putative methyltransferase